MASRWVTSPVGVIMELPDPWYRIPAKSAPSTPIVVSAVLQRSGDSGSVPSFRSSTAHWTAASAAREACAARLHFAPGFVPFRTFSAGFVSDFVPFCAFSAGLLLGFAPFPPDWVYFRTVSAILATERNAVSRVRVPFRKARRMLRRPS